MDFLSGLKEKAQSFLSPSSDDRTSGRKGRKGRVSDAELRRGRGAGSGAPDDEALAPMPDAGFGVASDADVADATGDMPKRSDILYLLKIPDNYEIPDEILLPGDIKHLTFDKEQPEGYMVSQVNKFVDTVSTSLRFYKDLLQRRNEDVARLATQVDKYETDLHNAKFNAELSDGLTVWTDQQAPADKELMQAKMEINRLNAKLAATAGQSVAPGSKKFAELQQKYDELQNQLAMEQIENRKLQKQLKRQQFQETAREDEGTEDYNQLVAPAGKPVAPEGANMPAPQQTAPSQQQQTAPGQQGYADYQGDDGGLPDMDDDGGLPSIDDVNDSDIAAPNSAAPGRSSGDAALPSYEDAAREEDSIDFGNDELPDDSVPYNRPSQPKRMKTAPQKQTDFGLGGSDDDDYLDDDLSLPAGGDDGSDFADFDDVTDFYDNGNQHLG